MMYHFLVLSFITATFCFSSARADIKDRAYFICKNQKQVRTLRVQPAADGKSCEVVYTKEGVSKVEGSGQYFEGCMKVLGNIRTNLEKGWFKCKDVTSTAQID